MTAFGLNGSRWPGGAGNAAAADKRGGAAAADGAATPHRAGAGYMLVDHAHSLARAAPAAPAT